MKNCRRGNRTASMACFFHVVVLMLLAAGCALQPARMPEPGELAQRTHWSGRLVLQVQGQTARDREQTVTAHFDLSGKPDAGELRLSTPLGGTLAHIVWDAHGAALDDGRQTHTFASLDELLRSTSATPVPAAALFEWLRGVEVLVDGWQVDLRQLANGRLSAQRLQPLPRAHLRLVLDTP